MEDVLALEDMLRRRTWGSAGSTSTARKEGRTPESGGRVSGTPGMYTASGGGRRGGEGNDRTVGGGDSGTSTVLVVASTGRGYGWGFIAGSDVGEEGLDGIESQRLTCVPQEYNVFVWTLISTQKRPADGDVADVAFEVVVVTDDGGGAGSSRRCTTAGSGEGSLEALIC